MINAEDEIYIDLRTSCTRDEAAAKLLGWMKGHVRKVNPLAELDCVDNDLQNMSSLEGSLADKLYEMREAARQEFINALKPGFDASLVFEKEFAVLQFDALIDDAMGYLLAIDEELAKDDSALRIDKFATEKSGVIHITLKSLDQWAVSTYGISIINSLGNLTKGDTCNIPASQRDDTEPSGPAQGDNEPADTEPTVTEPGDTEPSDTEPSDTEPSDTERDSKGGLGKLKANNLYTTLALAVELLVDILDSKKVIHGDRTNVRAVAILIAAKCSKEVNGQGVEAIDDKITAAKKIYATKIKGPL